MYYKGKVHNIKGFIKNSTIEEKILEYTEEVRRNTVKCHLPSCWQCNTQADLFKPHAKRQRQFYVIVDELLKIKYGLLMRWKCPGCNKTFTDYPEFAVPYKRYTVPTIKKYIGLYTENFDTTYREIIIKNIVGYPGSEKQLNHTTIHRWLTSFGNYNEIIRTAQDIYLQAKPESNICRELASLSVPLKKYHTEKRKGILQKCRQLLKIEKKFHLFFSFSIFTHLATKCGFS